MGFGFVCQNPSLSQKVNKKLGAFKICLLGGPI